MAPDGRPGPGTGVFDGGVRTTIEALLEEVDADLASSFPGERAGGAAQPVHTVYLTAAEVTEATPADWGTRALELAGAQRDLLVELARSQSGGVDTESIIDRVVDRLRHAPIADLRIDLEDGYGWRDDEVEDAHARNAGVVLAHWSAGPTSGSVPGTASAPSTAGVRTKGLGALERARGLRTLELVLDAAGGVPDGFVFTVPKLRDVRQVEAVNLLCAEFERVHGLAEGSLRYELQIEIPQAVLGPDGRTTLARAIHRGVPRLIGLHYGTYDYSAACGIVAAEQSLAHPVADHAKVVMQAAAAQTGVWISDGSTQVMPTGDPRQCAEALSLHHALVTRSLRRGIYQGWDMHPGHLVTRWLAVIGFFRSAMPAAARRLHAYLERQNGEVADEPATAVSLMSVIERGVAAGAFTADEVTAVAPAATAERLAQLRASGGGLDVPGR